MPCLNEERTIKICIKKAFDWLESNNVSGEIIIGDNGSTDKSVDFARESGATVINVKTPGYGAACYYSAKSAKGKYIIMGDADDSYDFSRLELFLEKLREGNELVMGNRFKGGIKDGAMPWKNKYIGNPVLSRIGKILFDVPAGDFLCGLRGFTSEAFNRLDLQTTGMEYGSEMVIKATLLKMKIAEVPTTLSKDGRNRPPHLQPWRDGWRNLRFMLLYSPRWLFWYPGWIAIITGLSLLIWLYPQPRAVGNIVLDIHTMLYASLFVIGGYQSITFGIITRRLGSHLNLIPDNINLKKIDSLFRLEQVLIFGILLVFIGIFGFIKSIALWNYAGYGELSASETMRIIIPTSLFFITGIQSILFTFTMSFIDLGIRK